MGFFKKKNAPEPIEQKPKLVHRSRDYYVVGTEYDQSGTMTGQDIMDVIPKRIIKNADEKLYNGYTKKEMRECGLDEVSIYQDFEFDADLVDTEFGGEIGVKVYLVDDEETRHGIGWLPKKQLEDFRSHYNEHCTVTLTIDGGKTKDLYGDSEEYPYKPLITIGWWEEV